MSRTARCLLGWAMLLALTTAVLAADGPMPRADDSRSAPQPPPPILVIGEPGNGVLRFAPRLYVLTPEEYERLKADSDRLKAQAPPPRPATPSSCEVSGSVDGDLARLRVEFKFETQQPRTTVLLACGEGQPSSASLDGKLPLLQYTKEGFVVIVESPGVHALQLDLEVPVTARGDRPGERGFSLDLPHAAITTLQLDLPEGTQEARLSRLYGDGKTRRTVTLKPTPGGGQARLGRRSLGVTDRVEVAWHRPGAAPQGPPMLAAQGEILVRFFDQGVQIDADLTLKVLRGEVSRWRLQVPPQATVEVATTDARRDEARSAIVEPHDPKSPFRTIRLAEPSAEPLRVLVRARQPRGQNLLPVGPFYVVGAFYQRGTVLVAAPPEARLYFHPRGDLSRRDVTTKDERPDFKPSAAFTYWGVPASGPLLEMEIENARGLAATSLAHNLTLTPKDGWRLSTTINATPLPSGADQVQLQLPADFQLDKGQPPRFGEPSFTVTEDPQTRIATLTLGQRQSRPFSVTVQGNYTLPPPAPDVRGATLDLPVPVRVADRGGKVTVVLPEKFEAVANRSREPARDPGEPRRHNVITWVSERAPERAEFTWRPHRPEWPVEAVVDITVSGGRALVRHQLWFPSSQPPSTMPFRVPRPAVGLQVVERGKTQGAEVGGTALLVALTETVSEERPLVLSYAFPLPENGAAFSVPLAVPEQTVRGRTRVRVWAEPGTLVEVAGGGPWQEQRLEVVPGQEMLPSLVLTAPAGAAADLPLQLRCVPAPSLAAIVLERALVRVLVADNGQQVYRASLLLSRADVRHLDLELPAPPALVGLKVLLDGKVPNWSAVDEAGRPAPPETARLVRVPIGAGAAHKPLILEVSYQLVPGQVVGRNGGAMPWQAALYPPVLRGRLGQASVRWQVTLPSSWIALYHTAEPAGSQTWGQRGGLLAPRPATTAADLDRWFGAGSTSKEEAAEAPELSVVCWGTDLEAVQVTCVPQQFWLLACSLGVLVVGLLLYFLGLPRKVFWPVAAVLGVGVATAGLLWPGVMAAVAYGCQPGLLVLLVVLLLQWVVQQRYRRQLVFLPGFTRRKAGSSLVRAGNGHRGEPTTVDALPAPSSGQRPISGSRSDSGRRKDGSASQTAASGQ